MTDERGKPPANQPQGNEPRRKAYRRPELRVLGAVHLLTRSAGSVLSGDGMAMMMGTSDRNAKQNIVRIGEHPLGIGLYLFDYKPAFRAQAGDGRQFGVMADEVEAVMPEAVSMHVDGYKMVDYAVLGVWRAAA